MDRLPVVSNVGKVDKLCDELLGTDTLFNQILLKHLNNIGCATTGTVSFR
jgi:hypothetical protein